MTVADGSRSDLDSDAGISEEISRGYRAMARLAFLLCGDRTEAEDLVAEAYTRAWRPWRSGSVEDLGPYTKRILVNLCLDRRRRRSAERDRRERTQQKKFEPDPSDGVTRHLDLTRALARLPSKQRTVIVLRYYEDMSEEEVARTLDLKLGTVKSRASRAIRTMAPMITRE